MLIPDMIGFAEDMSYNPHIKKKKVKVLIDSDGDITSMIPWLIGAGIEGIYPLERQSNVDVHYIRKEYPQFLMLGG